MGVNDTPISLPRVSILQVHDEALRVMRVCVVRCLQLLRFVFLLYTSVWLCDGNAMSLLCARYQIIKTYFRQI